jgi:hypothetical protein
MIVDVLVNIGIVLTGVYCVVMAYVQIKDWIRKRRRM